MIEEIYSGIQQVHKDNKGATGICSQEICSTLVSVIFSREGYTRLCMDTESNKVLEFRNGKKWIFGCVFTISGAQKELFRILER